MRNVFTISPVNMAEENKLMVRKFLHLANDLNPLKFIASSMAGKAKLQYDEFFKKKFQKNRKNFLEFDMRKKSVDECYDLS